MRKYETSAVDFLQAESGTMKSGEITVHVKRIPGEERSGYIDPQELAIMKEHWVARDNAAGAPPKEMTPEEAIAAMRENMGFPNLNLNTAEIHTKFETLHVGGNEVGLWRHYARKTQSRKDKPCLIYIHGGGWVGGSTYTVENPCRLIAELADAVVFNVDYALAPEKKFPHGFNDCYGVLEHVYKHADEYGIDRGKIAIGGDSAGGNLSAAVSMKDRDMATKMLALQVLIYPCVTFINTGIPGYKFSMDCFEMSDEQKDIIDKLIMIGRPRDENDDSIQMGDRYVVSRGAAYSPYVSPMLAPCHEDLPQALCISAEFDGLRVQTDHYAMLMEKAGVKVKSLLYKGVAHAFLDKLGFVPQAEDLCIEIAKALKAL